jgi:hypothetical protein
MLSKGKSSRLLGNRGHKPGCRAGEGGYERIASNPAALKASEEMHALKR